MGELVAAQGAGAVNTSPQELINLASLEIRESETERNCGCTNLTMGCILLGIFNSLVTFFLGLILTAMAKGLSDKEKRRKRPEDADPTADVAFAIMVFMATLFFLKFLADLLYVFAVYNKRMRIVKKYILFWILFMVLFVIGYIKLMFQMRSEAAIGYLLFLAFNMYFISLVRSHSLKNPEGLRRPSDDP